MEKRRHRLEIPIFGPESGPKAAAAGAAQIELNRAGSYGVGGLTPTLDELRALLSSLPADRQTTIRVMIRPSAPEFTYSDEEYRRMSESISEFVGSGLLSASRGDGFVLGVLRYGSEEARESATRELWVHEERTEKLVKDGSGLEVVFHRAIDECLGIGSNKSLDLARLSAIGVTGILTSGGKGNAIDNVESLKKLLVSKERPRVIIGGGVRCANLREIVERVGGADMVNSTGTMVHSSCLRIEEDGRELFDEEEAKGICRVLDELGVEKV